ncbi:HvfC/BufC N-terminal domain-containing protein [Elioraea sp.]|uniref:HvfC/BufC N-terminal domain-containing protein n=1 Tax=Elioraea sp. TaxID=2185103 RepID=UPI003F707FF3
MTPVRARSRQAGFATALLAPAVPCPRGLTALGGEAGPRRFSVYRNNVVAGLARALGERFPVTRRLVGQEFFAAMAREFALAHPPRSPIMLAYGDGFPDFVETFPPAAMLPYLADLARLEAARVRAYHAADILPVGPEAFAAVAPTDVDRLRVGLHPAVQLIPSSYPIISIWLAHRDDVEVQPIGSWAGECALVSRPERTVELRRLSAAMAAFLLAVQDRHTIEEAAVAGLGTDPAFDIAEGILVLMGLGLVVTLDPEPRQRRGYRCAPSR